MSSLHKEKYAIFHTKLKLSRIIQNENWFGITNLFGEFNGYLSAIGINFDLAITMKVMTVLLAVAVVLLGDFWNAFLYWAL